MGSSKDSLEIEFMAETLHDYSIIAIQEVVTSSYGEDAILRLANALDEKGCCWGYAISDKTNGSGTEKYAFVYNLDEVRLVREHGLFKELDSLIVREPYLATFTSLKGDTVTLVNFHAVPKSKNPAKEIKELYKIDEVYTKYPLLYLGDFNLSQTDHSYLSLKQRGYASSMIAQKTSLKRICSDDCLSKEYDNFFYNTSEINPYDSYVIEFYKKFNNISDARKISDHCPIVLFFEIFK
jgi:endonuclease/exonuclease/phosphatase family metal-dependent hydrolase